MPSEGGGGVGAARGGVSKNPSQQTQKADQTIKRGTTTTPVPSLERRGGESPTPSALNSKQPTSTTEKRVQSGGRYPLNAGSSSLPSASAGARKINGNVIDLRNGMNENRKKLKEKLAEAIEAIQKGEKLP